MNKQVNANEIESEGNGTDEMSIPPKFLVAGAITASLERNREAEGNPFKYQMGETWDLTSNVSTDFVEQIQKKFKRKNKFHSYFSGLPSNKTPENLKKLIAGEIEFLPLAREVVKTLTSTANESESPNLVGGNIVLMHYKFFGEEDDSGRLMIVMVDRKGAFEFEKGTLKPRRLQPIDTEALRQAAVFDLTLFNEIYPEKEGSTYLQFIEGKSKADFFKTALGCDFTVTNQQSVVNVFEAIKQFASINKLKLHVHKKITEKVAEHIENNIGKQISIKTIQQLVDGGLPAGHELSGKFAKFANENGFKINAVFEATRQSYDKGISIKITDFQSNYSVQVKAASLGYAGSDKPVIVDNDLTYLKIPLSESDKENIRLTIGSRESGDEKSS